MNLMPHLLGLPERTFSHATLILFLPLFEGRANPKRNDNKKDKR